MKNPFDFCNIKNYSASIQHAIGVPDFYIMQRDRGNGYDVKINLPAFNE